MGCPVFIFAFSLPVIVKYFLQVTLVTDLFSPKAMKSIVSRASTNVYIFSLSVLSAEVLRSALTFDTRTSRHTQHYASIFYHVMSSHLISYHLH